LLRASQEIGDEIASGVTSGIKRKKIGFDQRIGTDSMPMLVPDDQFPDIELSIAGGGTISLPGDVAGNWAYILFYRGGW
jgi:hypothetical protein